MLIRVFLTWLAAWLVVLPMKAEAQSLHEAAERGDLPGVERLIAAGVPIDATDAAQPPERSTNWPARSAKEAIRPTVRRRDWLKDPRHTTVSFELQGEK